MPSLPAAHLRFAALTLDDEIIYVWSLPWCWGSLLFVLMRYGGFAVAFSRLAWEIPAFIGTHTLARHGHVELSDGPTNWVLLIQFVLFYTVEIALQMRIYAIYRRSRVILALNTTLFSMEITSMLALWWDSGCRTMTRTLPWDGESSVITSACAQENGFPWYWIPGFVFESWLAILALYKALQSEPREKLKKDILSTLVNDSGIYFGLITAVMGVHLGFSYTERLYYQLGSPILTASFTVGGTRLMLHLRRAFHRQKLLPGQGESALAFIRAEGLLSFWDVDTLY